MSRLFGVIGGSLVLIAIVFVFVFCLTSPAQDTEGATYQSFILWQTIHPGGGTRGRLLRSNSEELTKLLNEGWRVESATAMGTGGEGHYSCVSACAYILKR